MTISRFSLSSRNNMIGDHGFWTAARAYLSRCWRIYQRFPGSRCSLLYPWLPRLQSRVRCQEHPLFRVPLRILQGPDTPWIAACPTLVLLNHPCCAQAGFTVSGTEWQTVKIPFSAFSYDWSDYTGRCDTKDPRNGTQHVCCSAEHPEVMIIRVRLLHQDTT